MISPKLVVMTAIVAASSMGVIPALAQESQTADVSQSFENTVTQAISQDQDACVNNAIVDIDQDADAGDDATNDADVEQDADQSNKCTISQSQDADQDADVDNDVDFDADIEQEIEE
jgi:hypothetical protein